MTGFHVLGRRFGDVLHFSQARDDLRLLHMLDFRHIRHFRRGRSLRRDLLCRVSRGGGPGSSPVGITGGGLSATRQRGLRTVLVGASEGRASVTAGMIRVCSMSDDGGSANCGRGYPAFTECSWRIVDSTRRTARARASSMTRASSAWRGRSANPARLIILSCWLALSAIRCRSTFRYSASVAFSVVSVASSAGQSPPITQGCNRWES